MSSLSTKGISSLSSLSRESFMTPFLSMRYVYDRIISHENL